jgi:hypothetical protein
VYDINLYSIHISNNEERDNLPGLIAMRPLKRTARGRENDQLIAFIMLEGASTISDASLQAWMQKKGEEYYQTAGTVTFALRTMMEKINQEMLERNIKRAKDGAQLTALLSLVVVKRNLLYFASAGGTKSFFVSDQESVEIIGEGQPRGLGLNESLPIRFSQKELQANDILLLAPQSIDSWTPESLAGSNTLSIESLSRRVFNQSGMNLKAALLKFIPGNGTIVSTPLHRTQSAPGSQTRVELPGAVPTADAATEQASVSTMESQAVPGSVNEPLARSQPGARLRLQQEKPVSDSEKSERAYPAQKPDLLSPRTKVAIGKTAQSTLNFWESTKSRTFLFLRKLLPGMVDEPVRLNKPVLIFIALAVPLLFALIAGSVYVTKGKAREFDASLIQAQQYILQAEGAVNDEPSRLASLQQAMFWLEKAGEYGNSETLDALSGQVRTSLDQLQGIKRLELTPLFDGDLARNANITQMVATNSDVYLLDETSGTVKRYYLSGNEYLADSGFECGYNPENILSPISKLVDMVPAPAGNSFRAAVMVIDGAGVIEYCIPGEAGITGTLIPPDAGWISLKAISLYQGYLYILDTGGNAVYRYAGSGIQYDQKPTLFFDNQIPALTRAFDIEVNGDELYILRTNGEMVECTYSPLKDYKLTECMDPAPYGDMRTGAAPQPINFPEASFVQMKMTPSPDSSLYILDGKTKAVYHFSLQRNLQKIIHPILRDGEDINRLTPSALAISSGRIAFVAFGNKVYFSPLP